MAIGSSPVRLYFSLTKEFKVGALPFQKPWGSCLLCQWEGETKYKEMHIGALCELRLETVHPRLNSSLA